MAAEWKGFRLRYFSLNYVPGNENQPGSIDVSNIVFITDGPSHALPLSRLVSNTWVSSDDASMVLDARTENFVIVLQGNELNYIAVTTVTISQEWLLQEPATSDERIFLPGLSRRAEMECLSLFAATGCWFLSWQVEVVDSSPPLNSIQRHGDPQTGLSKQVSSVNAVDTFPVPSLFHPAFENDITFHKIVFGLTDFGFFAFVILLAEQDFGDGRETPKPEGSMSYSDGQMDILAFVLGSGGSGSRASKFESAHASRTKDDDLVLLWEQLELLFPWEATVKSPALHRSGYLMLSFLSENANAYGFDIIARQANALGLQYWGKLGNSVLAIDEAIDIQDQLVADARVQQNLQMLAIAISHLGAMYHERFHQAMIPQNLDQAISLLHAAIQHVTSKPNIHAQCLRRLAQAYHTRYQSTSNVDDCINAITVLSEACDISRNSTQILASNFYHLSPWLHEYTTGCEQHVRTAVPLERAIACLQRVMEDFSGGPTHPLFLHMALSAALGRKLIYMRLKERQGLEEVSNAIRQCRSHLSFQRHFPPELGYFDTLCELAHLLMDRFLTAERRPERLPDVDEAILIASKALGLAAIPSKNADYLTGLLDRLYSLRFDELRINSESDLDKSNIFLRQVVASMPPGNPSYTMAVDALVSGLCRRSAFSNTERYTEGALAIASNAFSLTGGASGQNFLRDWLQAFTLHEEFILSRNVDHLNGASAILLRPSVNTSSSTELVLRVGNLLSRLAKAYSYLYKTSRNPEYVHQSVACSLKYLAVSGTSQAYLQLGLSLEDRWRITGSNQDIEDLIQALSTGVRLSEAEGDRPDPALLVHLGRYLHYTGIRDVDPTRHAQAMAFLQRAVDDSVGQEPLHSLCLAYLILGLSVGWAVAQYVDDDEDDSDEDDDNSDEDDDNSDEDDDNSDEDDDNSDEDDSDEDDSDDDDSDDSDDDYAVVLTKDAAGNDLRAVPIPTDLAAMEELLLQIPTDSPYYPVAHQVVLVQRVEMGRQHGNFQNADKALQDLDESIQNSDSVDRGVLVGFSLSGGPEHQEIVIRKARAAALDTCKVSWERFGMAYRWVQAYQSEISNVVRPECLEAYDVAIGLLEQVMGLNRRVAESQAQLTDSGYHPPNFPSGSATSTLQLWTARLPAEAAANAVRCSKMEKAVEWLERGRCLVWNQLQTLRTPLNHLEEHAPLLAQRLRDVSRYLEDEEAKAVSLEVGDLDCDARIALEEASASRVRASKEWEGLLDEARQIPGFEDFLRPARCSTLLQHLPKSGPVIMLNAHESRCDAIVLSSGIDEPMLVPLAKMTYKRAKAMQDDLMADLKAGGLRMRGELRQEFGEEFAVGNEGSEDEGRGLRPARCRPPIERMLRELWESVVKPVLDALAFNEKSIRPTGIYGCGAISECLADYAVSSYIPTVSALTARVREKLERTAVDARLLLVSVPEAEGQKPIHGTTREVGALRNLATSNAINHFALEGEKATAERVMEEISNSTIVHLACHGSQNVGAPMQSGFFLQDKRLDLSTIIKANVKNPDLAFLSACQTGTGDEKLSNEAVHLAAGMLAAGFRGTVATMWAIKDAYAPKVSEDFYKDLVERGKTRGGGIDGEDAAYALHYAMQELKKIPMKKMGGAEKWFLTWVPYVHHGI